MLILSTIVFAAFFQNTVGTIYRDCLEALHRGNFKDGVYEIRIFSWSKPFKVFCDQTTFGGGWIVIQRHSSSQTTFKRTSNEYLNGFGNISDEFWLGNQFIRSLTEFPHNLLVQLRRYDSKIAHAHYESFSIDGWSSGYKLRVSGYSGSAGNALEELNNVRFSVRKDISSYPTVTSGWWHNSKEQTVDLNAPQGPKRLWKGFGDSRTRSLTFTEMKIKPERERLWDKYLRVEYPNTVRYPLSGNFSALSVCWWMRRYVSSTSTSSSTQTVFSIEFSGQLLFALLMRQLTSSQKEIKVFLLQNSLSVFTVMSREKPHDFDHWCIVISSSTLMYYTNGRLSYSSPINNTIYGIVIPQGSELVLGGSVELDGVAYPAHSRFDVTNFNGWDKGLSENVIYSMSGFCHAQTGSLIVAWPEVLARNRGYSRYDAIQCVAAEAMHWKLSDSNGTSISDQRKTRRGTLSGSRGTADTKLGVLSIQGQAQADLGDISDTCLGEPELCGDGLTLRFWIRHRDKFLSKILGSDAAHLAAMDKLLQGAVPHYAKWRRCYHGDTDGFSAERFHTKCDYKGPTITLIRVGTFIFGGFSDQNWGGTNQNIPSVSAFLFSIQNFANKPPLKMKIKDSHTEQALYNDNMKGPVFGPDLQINFDEKFQVQRYSTSKGLGTSYELPEGVDPGSLEAQDLLTGSSDFSVDDIEVFYYDVLHKAAQLRNTQVFHDSQFKASSEAKLTSFSASQAKMSREGWCSYDQSQDQYLRLNFSKTVRISKVKFTGSAKEGGLKQGWLTSVIITSTSWPTNHSIELDLGNATDPDQKVVKHVHINASSLVIQAKTWKERICMRIEVVDIEGNKLVESLPDEAMTASSYICETPAHRTRLSYPWRQCMDAWCASSADLNPWIQIDLVQPQIIFFVGTQGAYNKDMVMLYSLMYSMNGTLWYTYEESRKTKIFAGNSLWFKEVKNAVLNPFLARLVRLVPLKWIGLPCLRVEFYIQVPECQLVALRYQSTNSSRPNHEAKKSISDSPSNCWIPQVPQDSWLQIELKYQSNVCCIQIEGINNGTHAYLTTSFQLAVSDYKKTWVYYKDRDGQNVFEGNSVNRSSVKLFLYPAPRVRFVRIYPKTFLNMPCLRVKIFAYADKSSSVIVSTNPDPEGAQGLHFSYAQTYQGETLTNSYTVVLSTLSLTWKYSFTLHYPGWQQVVIKWNQRWGLVVTRDSLVLSEYMKAGIPSKNYNTSKKLVLGDMTSENGQENLQISDLKYWSALIGHSYVNSLKNRNLCSGSNWCLQSTNEGDFQWQKLSKSSTPTPWTGSAYLSVDGQLYENVAHLTTTLDHSSDVMDAWRAFDGKLYSSSRIKVMNPQWLRVDFGKSVYVFSVEIYAWSRSHAYFKVDFDLELSRCETLTLGIATNASVSLCATDYRNLDRYFTKSLNITFTNLTSNGLNYQNIVLEEIKVRSALSAGGMYIESSFPQVQGDKAYLRTRTILNSKSDVCVQFSYYMQGKELGKLSSYKESYDCKEKTLLWRKAGEETSEIRYTARFPVHSKEPFQILFEGVVGPGFLSDIVLLDNIYIYFSWTSCHVLPSTEYLPRRKEIVSSIIGHVLPVRSSLDGWLSHVGWGERYWRPCYNSQEDGWNTTVFHTNCDNVGPTITVVKAFDHVFGGFTDQSWGSANDTYKSSTKAFLFSFKGVQNEYHTQYKIRQNYTFAQFLSAREGPIFGDSELSLTQNMRIVKANPLKMFATGNSNNSVRLTENGTTFVDAVEVLHLKDSACLTTCELYKRCDEYTGKCVCDKSIPWNRMCENDNQLSNQVKDAVFYWPLDGHVIDMKGRAWYSTPDNTVNRTVGVLSQGVQLRDPTSSIDLGVASTCFALIDNCTDGLTVSFWMMLDHQSKGVLFSSGGKGYGWSLGICKDEDTGDLCLNFTTLHTKCSYRFKSFRSYWSHYTITIKINILEVLVYVNGQKGSMSQKCESTNSTWPSSSRVTLSGNAKFDELIVWYSVFSASEVGRIYNFYDWKDKKAMEVFFVFRSTSHSWSEALKDKENYQYQIITDNIENNVLGIYTAQGSSSKIKTISVKRIWEGSVYVNLSIVYLEAIYDLPELLYNTVQQTGSLGSVPVDNLAMYLDNVYNGTVQSVKISDTQETSLTISWSAANENAKAPGIVQGYRVIGSYNGMEFYTKDLTGNITSHTVENLTPCTAFVFTIRVFSLVAYGKQSAPVSKVTLCEAPRITVSGLHGYNTSATSILIQWDPVSPSQVPGVFEGYRVYFTPTVTSLPNATAKITVHPDSSNATLVELKPYTNYTVAVLVYNGRESKENATIVVTTDESVPVIAPPSFSIISLSATTLMAKWQRLPLEYRGGIILGYKLTYSVIGNTIFASDFLAENILFQYFNDLPYDTHYSFNISAYTRKGSGPIRTLKKLTGAGVPYEKPQNLTAENLTTTSTIPVTWLPISRDKALGKLQGYFLSYQAVMVGEEYVDNTRLYEILVPSNQTHYQLSGLDSYTKYKITVAGFTSAGRGPQAMAFAETCRCSKRLLANWMTQIPYVNINLENSTGIIPEITKNLVSSCCKTCKAHGASFVDYQTSSKTTLNSASFQMSISHSFDMSFPIYGYVDQDTYKEEYGFVPMVESPGVTFIVHFSEDENSSVILDSLFKCWPLFIFILILIWLSGIIIWFLDSNMNTQHFPTGFLRGTGNGIWWAITTMTTVGYGDRFPVSGAARIFTIVWSLTGILLLGMLNASLANSMTSVSFSSEVQLYGCKIGAIHDSPEHRLGIRKNAKVNTEHQYSNYEDIANDLLKGRIQGALIDTYVLSKRKDLFDRPSFRIMKVLDYSSAYGAVLGGPSRKLMKCVNSYMKSNRATVFGIIQKNVGKVEDNKEPLALKLSSNLFDSSSKEYSDTIFYLVVLLGAAIVLGFLWSIIMKKTHKVHVSNASKYMIEAEMKRKLTEFNERMEFLAKRLKRKHAIQLLEVLKHEDVKKQET